MVPIKVHASTVRVGPQVDDLTGIDRQTTSTHPIKIDKYEHEWTKTTHHALVALQYLNLGVAPAGERRCHLVLAKLLALRGRAPIVSSCTGDALPPEILRHIESLIPKDDRERIARIRCQSLSNRPPEALVFELLNRLNPSKIENILGELALVWDFAKPADCTWCEYFDSESIRPRDQALLDLLHAQDVDLGPYSNDPHVILAAVVKNGRAIQYASAALQNNREIVLAAVRQDGWALCFCPTFCHDREIALAAVRQHGQILRYVSESLKNDREIVLAAVNQYGNALLYASNTLRRDREIVLAAVTNRGPALQYVHAPLRTDPEITHTAHQTWANRRP